MWIGKFCQHLPELSIVILRAACTAISINTLKFTLINNCNMVIDRSQRFDNGLKWNRHTYIEKYSSTFVSIFTDQIKTVYVCQTIRQQIHPYGEYVLKIILVFVVHSQIIEWMRLTSLAIFNASASIFEKKKKYNLIRVIFRTRVPYRCVGYLLLLCIASRNSCLMPRIDLMHRCIVYKIESRV